MTAGSAIDRTPHAMRPGPRPRRAERGAILVQTALMLVGLTAFGAFIVDYGVLWTARRQVQNAADAAALAAAISLGFDAPGDQSRARANALVAVGENRVWGAVADMTDGDVTFPACPVGSVPAAGGGVCVRVAVFRNQRAGSTPLPTIFAKLVGILDQGVRATATAQVLYGSSTDCVRPIAIPDRWQELRGDVGPAGWDELDTFERYVRPGGRVLLPPPLDFYAPPNGAAANGTGYARVSDYGTTLEFAPAVLPGRAGNSSFVPVHVVPGGSFASELASCSTRVISPGDRLDVNFSNVTGDFSQWVRSLVAADPAATWDPSMNGGRGGVSGGCMSTGGCTISPRIVALPVFDPDQWDAAGADIDSVEVTRVAGFFVSNLEGSHMLGRMMVYPVEPGCKMAAVPYDCRTMTADSAVVLRHQRHSRQVDRRAAHRHPARIRRTRPRGGTARPRFPGHGGRPDLGHRRARRRDQGARRLRRRYPQSRVAAARDCRTAPSLPAVRRGHPGQDTRPHRDARRHAHGRQRMDRRAGVARGAGNRHPSRGPSGARHGGRPRLRGPRRQGRRRLDHGGREPRHRACTRPAAKPRCSSTCTWRTATRRCSWAWSRASRCSTRSRTSTASTRPT